MREKLEEIIKECKEKYSRSPMAYVSHKVKANKNLYEYVESFRSKLDLNTNSFNELLYCIINETERPKCLLCENKTRFIDYKEGYSKFCSRKCSKNTDEYRSKMTLALKGKSTSLKGKTYKEIYGTDIPKCGFRKGDDNQAKKEDVKIKISKGVKKSYTEELKEVRRQEMYKRIDEGRLNNFHGLKYENSKGEKYRSNLEVLFSEILITNNISYKYEVTYKLNNGQRKIVDFVLEDFILVEITGYAYTNWQLAFQKKIKLLRESVDNPILVLTYSEMLDKLREDLFFGVDFDKRSIYDTKQILRAINFMKGIDYTNKHFNNI